MQTVTFQASSLSELQQLSGGDTFYSRHGNPTIAHAEGLIAELEGASSALVFGSGMAVVTTTLLSLLNAGDHVVAHQQLYGATFVFMRHWLKRFQVDVTLVDVPGPG